jgi:hypothetical protein
MSLGKQNGATLRNFGDNNSSRVVESGMIERFFLSRPESKNIEA